jgi:hypothetical protein
VSTENADVVVAPTDLHKTYPKNLVQAVDGVPFGTLGEVWALFGSLNTMAMRSFVRRAID